MTGRHRCIARLHFLEIQRRHPNPLPLRPRLASRIGLDSPANAAIVLRLLPNPSMLRLALRLRTLPSSHLRQRQFDFCSVWSGALACKVQVRLKLNAPTLVSASSQSHSESILPTFYVS